ncbi:DNA topoisomerase III [Desulfitobacterium dehalogenans ATCC 51507]|uniref:DNA topoisomerase n=1 Tax=Desulfitobacterium dehalogenans (strain ATCC 51507 / DSM 9161 / JW/IU-DC1) TaxID=756499 RepID=I4AAN3_DESDJ|nr:type IA DNA topoisomerase [Desulfitobacterium dehalogenans]AFM01018.1 DNA topoisomerase III [Desulfitobacterium dehalogenans ATCC 51507]
MGKTLIIAEKPSQAREYAKTLGVKGKGEGYFENDDYIISWCIGHLFELKPPETYMDLFKVGKRWGIHRLPVLPQLGEFQYELKPSTLKQYNVLQRLLKSQEVRQVICGTDADREGQLLFQEVWDTLGSKKPLFRLWISSLTQEAIREGMSKLRPFHEVEGLAQAGYGRSYGDWDFGMNLTEGFTALFGSFDPVRKKPNVISIGRVQTPTLALVVEREWAIQNFVPVSYVELEAEFESAKGCYKGKWFDKDRLASHGQTKEAEKDQETDRDKHILDLERGKAILAKVQGRPGKVCSVKDKESTEPHPLLFDLTSLTVTASKRYGFGAEKVLKIAQSLYEKKAITYPRTDCNYLPPDMLPKLKSHLKALEQGPFEQWAKEALDRPLPKGKRVINEITAHHAIIPTTERIAQNLSPDEQKIWEMIVLRFLSTWFPPARYAEREIITVVEDEFFLTKEKTLLEPGWKRVEKTGKHSEDSAPKLPSLSQEERVGTRSCQVLQKETKPPKRYTQGDLIKAMEGAGKEVEDETLRRQLKGKGLGTVATRGAIIENLLTRGYILQQQKVLVPTEKGMELIRLIKERLPRAQLLISAEMTGQMEYELAQVERGEIPLSRYMEKVEQAVRGIIEELRHYEATHGKKPLAFAPQKQGTQGRKSKSNQESRSQEPHAPKTDKAKDGKESSASASGDSLGTCPSCGGGVEEREKGYGCQNWKKGCPFILWKNPICGKVLTPAQVKSLLKKGRTNLIKGFRSKNGKNFAAYLVWENPSSGKLKFEFERNNPTKPG